VKRGSEGAHVDFGAVWEGGDGDERELPKRSCFVSQSGRGDTCLTVLRPFFYSEIRFLQALSRMPELLDLTPPPDEHPTGEVHVGETVKVAWTVPVDADPSDVEIDLLGGETVTGSQLEKKDVGGGEYEFRPRHGEAPTVQSTYQIVQLRLEGDPGAVDVGVIHAESVPG
jgi:hypothetical protein